MGKAFEPLSEEPGICGTLIMKTDHDFSKGKRGAVLPTPLGKERITIRLDREVVDWFRQQADRQGGGNYQTMINQALKEYMLGQQAPLEELLRRVVREELGSYKAGES
jgi:uncharacterized protein (DUF4415 family)